MCYVRNKQQNNTNTCNLVQLFVTTHNHLALYSLLVLVPHCFYCAVLLSAFTSLSTLLCVASRGASQTHSPFDGHFYSLFFLQAHLGLAAVFYRPWWPIIVRRCAAAVLGAAFVACPLLALLVACCAVRPATGARISTATVEALSCEA